jgi:hypothetical protein
MERPRCHGSPAPHKWENDLIYDGDRRTDGSPKDAAIKAELRIVKG